MIDEPKRRCLVDPAEEGKFGERRATPQQGAARVIADTANYRGAYARRADD